MIYGLAWITNFSVKRGGDLPTMISLVSVMKIIVYYSGLNYLRGIYVTEIVGSHGRETETVLPHREFQKDMKHNLENIRMTW